RAGCLPCEPRRRPSFGEFASVERLAEIISFYRETFQNNTGQVAACQHKVQEYNQACHLTHVPLTFNRAENRWEFPEGKKVSLAYRLTFTPKGSRHSLSHSGVEYVRAFDETDELKFARRMCNKSSVPS